MSHTIAPEITIESTPILLELCSDEAFDLDNMKVDLDELNNAAESIKVKSL